MGYTTEDEEVLSFLDGIIDAPTPVELRTELAGQSLTQLRQYAKCEGIFTRPSVQRNELLELIVEKLAETVNEDLSTDSPRQRALDAERDQRDRAREELEAAAAAAAAQQQRLREQRLRAQRAHLLAQRPTAAHAKVSTSMLARQRVAVRLPIQATSHGTRAEQSGPVSTILSVESAASRTAATIAAGAACVATAVRALQAEHQEQRAGIQSLLDAANAQLENYRSLGTEFPSPAKCEGWTWVSTGQHDLGGGSWIRPTSEPKSSPIARVECDSVVPGAETTNVAATPATVLQLEPEPQVEQLQRRSESKFPATLFDEGLATEGAGQWRAEELREQQAVVEMLLRDAAQHSWGAREMELLQHRRSTIDQLLLQQAGGIGAKPQQATEGQQPPPPDLAVPSPPTSASADTAAAADTAARVSALEAELRTVRDQLALAQAQAAEESAAATNTVAANRELQRLLAAQAQQAKGATEARRRLQWWVRWWSARNHSLDKKLTAAEAAATAGGIEPAGTTYHRHHDRPHHHHHNEYGGGESWSSGDDEFDELDDEIQTRESSASPMKQ